MKKMEHISTIFKSMIAVVFTITTWFLGDWDMALLVLLLFMGFDYVSGWLAAYVNQTLSSDIGLKGLSRKFMIILVLMGAVSLDRLITDGQTWIFRTAVCYFYVANEGLSLLENAARLGLPIPKKLENALIQLKDGNKKEIKE